MPSGYLRTCCRKTQLCRYSQVSLCPKGRRCSYAHGESELRAVPDFRNTKVCPALRAGRVCRDANCRFAHSQDQVRKAVLRPNQSEEPEALHDAWNPIPRTSSTASSSSSTVGPYCARRLDVGRVPHQGLGRAAPEETKAHLLADSKMELAIAHHKSWSDEPEVSHRWSFSSSASTSVGSDVTRRLSISLEVSHQSSMDSWTASQAGSRLGSKMALDRSDSALPAEVQLAQNWDQLLKKREIVEDPEVLLVLPIRVRNSFLEFGKMEPDAGGCGQRSHSAPSRLQGQPLPEGLTCHRRLSHRASMLPP